MELKDKNEEKKIARERVVPYVEKYYRYYCNEHPSLRFQRMTSRWGSCRPANNSMSFNTFLAYVPEKCVEYVVVHELSHYRQMNHSPEFYTEISWVMPDYKQYRKEIRKYEVIINEYRRSRNNVRRHKRFSIRQLYSRRP